MIQTHRAYEPGHAMLKGSLWSHRAGFAGLHGVGHGASRLPHSPGSVHRWNARPQWFSSTTALCPTTSGCSSRACTSSPCWWRLSSLRGDISTGTSLLAGVGHWLRPGWAQASWPGISLVLLSRSVKSEDGGTCLPLQMAHSCFLGPFSLFLPMGIPLSERVLCSGVFLRAEIAHNEGETWTPWEAWV